jgi:hypothetical protein
MVIPVVLLNLLLHQLQRKVKVVRTPKRIRRMPRSVIITSFAGKSLSIINLFELLLTILFAGFW